MHLHRALLGACLVASSVSSQHLCEGNGYGGAYVEAGPGYLGGPFRLDVGSPNAPSSICFFSISGGFQETTHPVVGPICLDVFSPFYQVVVLPTGPDGNLHFELFLPDIPSWVTNPPFYADVATFEGGQLSISKTVPLWFENPASWTPTQPMAEPRFYHTATYLGGDDRDDRIQVLVAGGCEGTVTVPVAVKASTEIFDPLGRTFTPGPDMSVARATHTATRLQDGRVLIAGGLDEIGVCHATCEIFDYDAGTLSPAAPMGAPRAGHTATLLDDGRVLVTGGFADYQNPATAWMEALNTAQDTGEIYDPATDTWTPLAQVMASRRAGHSATKLSDGRVLLVGGVSGGTIVSLYTQDIPVFTNTCEVFDPATDTLTATANLLGGGARAFHGASVLESGDVLVTGGTLSGGSYGEAVSTQSCVRWDGAQWHNTMSLPVAVAWHGQVTLDDGRALVSGGLTASASTLSGKAFTGVHDGVVIVPATGVGLNEGIPSSVPLTQGAMEAVRMHDGAILFTGGVDNTSALSTTFVYTPPL